ncbi:GNAT family N-acetyltransferase [Streptomyces sp. NBC_01498]|uniref:GNAT family N-acetyltransferase n=1 Tax=Streptomyces sp. NBC_01498 TaxID=2975870 RepID=UPI002E7C3B72|nr:GNAT family N-acetyltransferase [Streptomyces sp. NBC_01498]WTL28220.1 GNAT family N-acetyltransferase [Streptomyces sp. NBC_01498]
MDTAPLPAPGPLTYRDATPDDVKPLVDLIESAYRGESARASWTSEAGLLEGQRTDVRGVLEVIEAEGSRLLMVETGGELVACCQLEHRGPAAYFGMFAVDPRAQGGGLGKRVLAEAERRARADWGVGEMHMTVIIQRTDLIAWYERRGYRRTGQLLPFPYGDERYGLPQIDDLAFELLVKPLDD